MLDNDGNPRWSFALGSPVHSPPVVAGDGVLYVGAARLVAVGIPASDYGSAPVLEDCTLPSDPPGVERLCVNIQSQPFNFGGPHAIGDDPNFAISTCVRKAGATDINDACDQTRSLWRPFLGQVDREVDCILGDPGCSTIASADFRGCDPDAPLTTSCPDWVAELRVRRSFFAPNGTRMYVPVLNRDCTRPFWDDAQGAVVGQTCLPEAFKVFAEDATVLSGGQVVHDPLSEFGAPDPESVPQICNASSPTFPACGSGRFMCSVRKRIVSPVPGGGATVTHLPPVCNLMDGDADGFTNQLLEDQGFPTQSGGPNPCTLVGTCTFPDCSGVHQLWARFPQLSPTVWVVEDLNDGGGPGEGPDTCGCQG